ncbi:hypothetical protein V6U78_02725 [Marinospirillum sp. MEB164]|uniref:LPP20 lipoprotein n=1 Tax=Marinospirillum alkalitolerans TaxID=3123374 RepID=A0ABW8PVF2_9GAMM
MKSKIFAASALAASLVLVGCAGTPQQQQPNLPSWIMAPEAQDGLAATGCVTASGNMNIDGSRADLAARQQLATTVGARLQSLTEGYQRANQTQEDGLTTGENFEQVARQLVDERLVGTRRAQAGYYTVNGQNQFCSMVVMGQQSVTDLLAAAAQAVGAEPEVFTSSQMREQFMHGRATDRMNEQLRNNNR